MLSQMNRTYREKQCGRSLPPLLTTGHLAFSEGAWCEPFALKSVTSAVGSGVVFRILTIAFLLIFPTLGFAQEKVMPKTLKTTINYMGPDLLKLDAFWPSVLEKRSDAIAIDRYWSGAYAPEKRHATARMLWSDEALWVSFEGNQQEPLVVSEKPDTSKKARGLWDRDVFEIFVAPNAGEPNKYFEFEVAPTGEWIDLALDSTSGKRFTDWEYASGMRVIAIGNRDQKIQALIRIPWTAFGKTPKAGDIWLGNLLRCIGNDPDRGYLAWSPTMTAEPNFHVPERFGEFHFVK